MLVEYLFRKLFPVYDYPFEKADAKIIRMKDPERTAYYLSARNVLSEPAYIQELQELIRSLYQELSEKEEDKITRKAYRLTLLALYKLHKRHQNLASMYKTPVISKSTDKLD